MDVNQRSSQEDPMVEGGDQVGRHQRNHYKTWSSAVTSRMNLDGDGGLPGFLPCLPWVPCLPWLLDKKHTRPHSLQIEKKMDREIKRILWLEEVIKLADVSESTTRHGVQKSHRGES